MWVHVRVRVLGKESESEYMMHMLLLVAQKECVSDEERRERKRNNT